LIKSSFNRGWSCGPPENPFAVAMGMKDAAPLVEVDLPYDAMIHGRRSPDAVTAEGEGWFEAEDLEYTKTFVVDAEDQGKAMWLEFEGAYMNTTVFVNETFIINWPNGYTNFFARIDHALRYGAENRVRVHVRNGVQRNSRWYAGGGIYRDVNLIVGGPVRVALEGVQITTVDADQAVATLSIRTDLEQEAIARRSVRVETTIRDASGAEVTSRTAKVTLVNTDSQSVVQRIYIENPQLWNIGRPNLYACETRILTLDGDELDTETTVFGIRKLELDAIRGLRINGEVVKLKGGCVHHDNGILGAATFADAEERRVVRLKAAGYNAIRSAHNPMSRQLLEACDRHGLVVMDEFTDSWNRTIEMVSTDYSLYFSEYWERDLERMVRRDFNHPSVIMYSLGNEITDIGNDVNDMWGFKLAAKVRDLDRTRYVTLAIQGVALLMNNLASMVEDKTGATTGAALDINTVMQNVFTSLDSVMTHPLIDGLAEQTADMLDVVGYNYASVRYELDHAKYPHRIFVGSETQPHALAENWDLVMKHPYVIGDFGWTAWDYLGEVGVGRIDYSENPSATFMGNFPWIAFYGSDIDLIGNRKPRSFWREIIWGGREHIPYIAVQPPAVYGLEAFRGSYAWSDVHASWTWPGDESAAVLVEVYSDADEIELLVNGSSVGRTAVGTGERRYACEFITSYQPGTIEAVAFIGGTEVGRHQLDTANSAGLVVTIDNPVLSSQSNDLCFVNIGFADAAGNEDLSVTTPITVSIDGPATIQASGSADPMTTEYYYERTHVPFWGKALVVVRAGDTGGVATLTVRSEGHRDVTVAIPVE
jgi:beta-galactosidase